VRVAPVRVIFPRFYSITNHNEAKLGELCNLNDGFLEWSLVWRRNFFVWENEMLEGLMEILDESC